MLHGTPGPGIDGVREAFPFDLVEVPIIPGGGDGLAGHLQHSMERYTALLQKTLRLLLKEIRLGRT